MAYCTDSAGYIGFNESSCLGLGRTYGVLEKVKEEGLEYLMDGSKKYRDSSELVSHSEYLSRL